MTSISKIHNLTNNHIYKAACSTTIRQYRDIKLSLLSKPSVEFPFLYIIIFYLHNYITG